MLYLLYGSDDYSQHEYLKGLVSRTALPRVDYAPDSAPKSRDELLAQDLFSGGQVIVLRNLAQRFLLEDSIQEFIKSSNHLIFVEAELDRRTKFAKDLLANKEIHAKEFPAPSPEELPLWVAEYVTKHEGAIMDVAMRSLLQRLGYSDPVGGLMLALKSPSLLRLEQELNKLLTYAQGQPITADMIGLLVPDDRQTIALSITDSLSKKNRTELFGLLEGYYKDSGGADETGKTLALVGLLSEQFRSQLIVKDSLERRLTEAEVLSQTGWKSGKLFVMKRLATSFTVQQLRDVLGKLESLDVELKSTSTPPRVVLELILAQMV